MNYRHAFHAGNFGDVLKHAILVQLIAHLKAKPNAFAVLDTHAGAGLYDLQVDAAQRTGEFRHGILRLLGSDTDTLQPYLEVIRSFNRDAAPDTVRHYPGSPSLARLLLRPQDRLVAVELHPAEFAALKRRFGRDRQVTLHHGDAYAALKGLLPPPERRGLVLIDPPFEERSEFDDLVRGLRHACRRWPTGIYAVWYPIKDRPPIARFHAALQESGMQKLLAAELLVRPDDDPQMLNGCGLVLINPPWRFDAWLDELLPVLRRQLAQTPGACAEARWLIAE